MARRGGRRGSRGRSSSRRSRGKSGGVGSSRSKSKSNKSKSKSKSKSTGGSRGRSSNTRGGQSKANRNQNKKARSTVKSVKKAVGKAAGSVGKSLKGAAANAANAVGISKKNKFQQQLSNLKKDIAQKSTKEARFERRKERMERMTGRDYDNMQDSFTVKANIDQAARKFGFHNNRFYKALPKSVRNFKFNATVKAPGKLSIRQKRLRGWKSGDGDRRRSGGGHIRQRNLLNQQQQQQFRKQLAQQNDAQISKSLQGYATTKDLNQLRDIGQAQAQGYRDQLASIQGGWDTMQSNWSSQFNQQRQHYNEQLKAAGITSQRERQNLLNTFTQQQQQSRLENREQRSQLESQLQTGFNTRFDEQQKSLTSKYENLLSQAKTEAEFARVAQSQKFEQRQLDQQAAWNKQSQQLADKDRVYQSQIGELKSELGIQGGLFSGLQDQYSSYKTSSSLARGALQSQLSGLQESSAAERRALETQLTGLQASSTAERTRLEGEIGGLQQEFGQAQQDWAKQAKGYEKQIGDVTGQLSGLQTTLGDYQKQNEQLQSAVKRNEELAIQNAERARVSASYGSPGQPLNKQVQGVRTLNELKGTNKMYGGSSGAFNRKGLRIRNLNI